MRLTAVVTAVGLLTVAACTDTRSTPVVAPEGGLRAVRSAVPAGSAASLGGAAVRASTEAAPGGAIVVAPSVPSASAVGTAFAILPAAYATMMGEGNNTFPHAWRDMRYQQAFLGSELGGLRALGRLCLRRDDVVPSSASTQHLTVKLGPTLLDPLALTTTFDANYSAPPTEVFSGDLVMPPSAGGGTVNDFYICIDFTRPYVHPAGANFIVEVVNTSTLFQPHFEDFCFAFLPVNPGDPGEGCRTRRVYAHSATATEADPLEDFQAGLVMKFVEARPSTRADCMDGGWENYGFANQGLCIRFVMTGH